MGATSTALVMPDWFYRTLARPLLFRLPATTGRDFALGFMGLLGRLPFGGAVIDFLGHMRAPTPLGLELLGVVFPTPIGLGPRLDADGRATAALSRFGIGFIEVGPVTRSPLAAPSPVERRPGDALWFPDPAPNPGLDMIEKRLRAAAPLGVPLIVRLGAAKATSAMRATVECTEMIARLSSCATLFSLATTGLAVEQGWSDDEWRAHVAGVRRAGEDAGKHLLLCLPADLAATDADRLPRLARQVGIGGCLVDGAVRAPDGGRLAGPAVRAPAQQLTWHLRRQFGRDFPIVGSGGVHQPEDALSWRETGADLVQVDTGLVYSGPGLPKRINDALLSDQSVEAQSQRVEPPRPTEMTWFWTLLMGAGMLAGSIMALAIAATRVVLPYDEAFVGLTRSQLAALNPHLLDFMAHDRVSLAGTMITIGVLYVGLSLGGVRRGLHWAQQAVFASAFSGFLTFFLFLGFGYFDPFHAFVTAILFQFFLLGLHARLGEPERLPAASLREDGRWRASLWGQLLFVLHGFGLIGAGLAISAIGVTSVFVPQDLHFMHTTAEALAAAHPRLVPLVAHDRATFGGMLFASGVGILLPALWGFRRGARWLWWTFLAAGLPAYASAIGVHLLVGYTSLFHLAPAFFGLGIFTAGLALSRPYLFGSHAS